jgi:hypothetical protein
MNRKTIDTYLEYAKSLGNRYELYKAVASKYDIKYAIYPGSHIDIAPSLVIPKVTYIDNFRGAIKFFIDMDSIKEYVDKNKDYEEFSEIVFLGIDYNKPLKVDKADLIISEYAGFAGQATKKYLKKGGILLCNNSHADATLANQDSDYEFVGVLKKSKGGYRVSTDKLNEYFILPQGKTLDMDKIIKQMKGPKYRKYIGNYLFRKKH